MRVFVVLLLILYLLFCAASGLDRRCDRPHAGNSPSWRKREPEAEGRVSPPTVGAWGSLDQGGATWRATRPQ
jgi:hypothetical protein